MGSKKELTPAQRKSEKQDTALKEYLVFLVKICLISFRNLFNCEIFSIADCVFFETCVLVYNL